MSEFCDSNFAGWVLRHVDTLSDKCALDLPDSHLNYSALSYSELGKQVASYQAGFKQHGYKVGDRIILVFPPGKDLYCLVMAMLASGLVPVFIDMGMGRKKISMAIEDAKAKAIISSKKLLKLKPILKPLWGLKSYSVDGPCLFSQTLDLLQPEGQHTVEVLPCSDDQHGLITFTSGSTGRPKGADRTHSSLIQQHLALLEHEPVGTDDSSLTSLPITALHTLACGIATILPPVDLAQLANIDADKLVDVILNKQATVLSGAPAYMKQLALAVLGREADLVSVRLLLIGGAAVSPELARLLLQAFPKAEVRIVYGSTESEPISSVEAGLVVSSENGLLVGKPCNSAQVMIVRLPKGQEIKEQDLDSYKCEEGVIGELIVKGPHVLKSYVDNPLATLESKIVCSDGEVWHRTGDTAYVDTDQNIFLVGRQKDIVSYEGEDLHPYLVELGVDGLPEVERSALIQVDEEPALAFTCANEEDAKVSINNFLENAGLAKLRLIRVTSIPVDGRHNSKIDRPALVQQIASREEGVGSKFIVTLNRVDCLTLSGVVAAFGAILLAISGHFAYALSCLFIAMLADALDGIWARKRGIERSFGRYLDGFVDELDYLIAPSIFLYLWGFDSTYQLVILLLFMMSGMVRLSVFNEIGNIKEDNGLGYLGMPVFWSVFILAGAYLLQFVLGKEIVLVLLALVLSMMTVLMVYKAPFFKFKSLKQILTLVLSGVCAFALIGVAGG